MRRNTTVASSWSRQGQKRQRPWSSTQRKWEKTDVEADKRRFVLRSSIANPSNSAEVNENSLDTPSSSVLSRATPSQWDGSHPLAANTETPEEVKPHPTRTSFAIAHDLGTVPHTCTVELGINARFESDDSDTTTRKFALRKNDVDDKPKKAKEETAPEEFLDAINARVLKLKSHFSRLARATEEKEEQEAALARLPGKRRRRGKEKASVGNFAAKLKQERSLKHRKWKSKIFRVWIGEEAAKRAVLEGDGFSISRGRITTSIRETAASGSSSMPAKFNVKQARKGVKGGTVDAGVVICLVFMTKGECPLGRRCPFVHDPSRIRTCPRMLRGLPCAHDPGGTSEAGKLARKKQETLSCPFDHNLDDRKLPFCREFMSSGRCRKGERCPYPHVQPSPSSPPCPHFMLGLCPRGSRCHMLHSYVTPSAVGFLRRRVWRHPQPQRSRFRLSKESSPRGTQVRRRQKSGNNRYFSSHEPQTQTVAQLSFAEDAEKHIDDLDENQADESSESEISEDETEALGEYGVGEDGPGGPTWWDKIGHVHFIDEPSVEPSGIASASDSEAAVPSSQGTDGLQEAALIFEESLDEDHEDAGEASGAHEPENRPIGVMLRDEHWVA